VSSIRFPGLGKLEAIPNGDAAVYIEMLGLSETIRETTRYALRWPGWSAFWRPLKQFGFLSDEKIDVVGCQITPHQFISSLIGPQLHYDNHEKDIVVMQNVFEGLKDGTKKRLTTNLLIERDLKTGLFAMNKGVGFPASIVAQMLAKQQIKTPGLLSPAVDIPAEQFIAELAAREIKIDIDEQVLE
jgi:saccharopine dehydrogenase-like NADP-dependent oxidoreductase